MRYTAARPREFQEQEGRDGKVGDQRVADEHGAKTFIRTNQKSEVTANPDFGLGIEIDWDVINRDWYSYLKLDPNGLKSEIRSI